MVAEKKREAKKLKVRNQEDGATERKRGLTKKNGKFNDDSMKRLK